MDGDTNLNSFAVAKNKIKSLLDAKKKTRYQFWKDTGLAQNTAYRLYGDPCYIPGSTVMDKIFDAYGWQPGDYLYCDNND